MVRHIVLLNALVVVVASPAFLVMMLNMMRSDILLNGSMRMVFIIMNLFHILK